MRERERVNTSVLLPPQANDCYETRMLKEEAGDPKRSLQTKRKKRQDLKEPPN
jgi:hypothetical protein